MGINPARLSISNLVAYSRAITAGQGVAEFEPEGKAAAEMRTLLTEVMSMCHFDDNATPSVGDDNSTPGVSGTVFDWLKIPGWGRRRDSSGASTPNPS